jgi:hypothetical protein
VIDHVALLADLRPLVLALTDDLRAHAAATLAISERLAADHRKSFDAGRTSLDFERWLEEELPQAAVMWVLSCVFVRFCEDNGLIADPLLSGPGARREAALGRRSVYFERHPERSDREYLQWCFAELACFPAVTALFDGRHTALSWLVPSVDGAATLRELWVRVDPVTGALVHDFSDPHMSTRFLGDLYQDLSDAAKKRYALLQTPHFVESFILDHTLEPALEEFGLHATRLIDPTCGSGHFLIGAFERLFARWQRAERGTPAPELAQRALGAVYGVDLNPFATAIARFRLAVAALRVCDIARLDQAPRFALNLATGDSLLHGPEHGRLAGMGHVRAGISHVYEVEDARELTHILGQGYHAVVGNPPYINVKDRALRDAYRERYESCHGKYALSVPFMERFFELASLEDGSAGYVGKITANSFMKREFGNPLVERFLPSIDVQALVDTSGAYIPGHGTPTLILFGRARAPVASMTRVLDAVRGEPGKPDDPARGLVWTSILERFDQSGTEDRFIRSSDVPRSEFAKHPMTLGIGRDLRKLLERSGTPLAAVKDSVGITSFTLEDDVYVRPAASLKRHRVERCRPVVEGDGVRDWLVRAPASGIFPYDERYEVLPDAEGAWARMLWPARTVLAQNKMFGSKTKVEAGLKWYEWGRLTASKLRTPLTITWGEVATHNHFVLDCGGKVFKQTAPVIKLPATATGADHLRLLGVLNSSTACFWLKQVCQPKGGAGIGRGIHDEAWELRHAFNATNVQDLPLPADRPLDPSRRLDALARERAALLDELPETGLTEHARALTERDLAVVAEMIALQEELDWQVLRAFDLVDDDLAAVNDPPPLALGERAFEIVLARQVAAGETQTEWFARHGSTSTTALPPHWPEDYAARVERRIDLIANDPDVGLIERPEHKRRWNGQPSFARRFSERLRSLVLDRLEGEDVWREPRLRSVHELGDLVRRDDRLSEACALLAGDPGADAGDVVAALVLEEAVPHLTALRHTPAGMRQRMSWERTWELQRAEDRGEVVGKIPVPSRYVKADFRSGTIWRLRGKLDVPNERFMLVPYAERGADGAPVVGWAGWDEGVRARALAARVLELQREEAAEVERLKPLLAGVLELLPWIHQWQPEPDPATGQPLGAFLDDLLDGTLSGLGLTRYDLMQWQAP